jgi:hypothetical protein
MQLDRWWSEGERIATVSNSQDRRHKRDDANQAAIAAALL